MSNACRDAFDQGDEDEINDDPDADEESESPTTDITNACTSVFVCCIINASLASTRTLKRSLPYSN